MKRKDSPMVGTGLALIVAIAIAVLFVIAFAIWLSLEPTPADGMAFCVHALDEREEFC